MYEKGCPHCPDGFGLKHSLFDDGHFLVVCDVHPLVEGHILIIPREHVSCMGALPDDLFEEYAKLYERVFAFLKKTYSRVAAFEHGITGQTVFHAHTHFLPFNKSIHSVVPEKDRIRKISTLDEIKTEFNKNHKYLYVAINNDAWLVDAEIGYPRIFRDRFARALDAEERGNWKKARDNFELMQIFERDIQKLKSKWTLSLQ